jgi:hypothetical protein
VVGFEVIMLAFVYVFLALFMRIPSVPHLWGFVPVTAALLYFGARGSRRMMWIPLLGLIAADIILDRYYSYPLSWDLWLTWAWYAAMLWLGTGLRGELKPLRIAGAALTGSVSFFLISNFGVWAATSMYAKSASGLVSCYVAAIPFFRHGLESDLLFTAVAFGLPVAARAVMRWMESTPRTNAAA